MFAVDPKAVLRRAKKVAATAAGLPARVDAELAAAGAARDSAHLDRIAALEYVRVAVIGDVHGEAGWVRRVLRDVTRHDVDVAVFAGDFGYWAHTREGAAYLDGVSRLAARADLAVVFVDGNHDNHDLLALLPRREDLAAPVRGHVTHVGRGWRAVWGGASIAALGGAASHDRFRPPFPRVAGFDWWEGETITSADVARLCADGPVDVLIAHDAPAALTTLPHEPSDPVCEAAAEINRSLLQQAVDATRPSLVVHGHHHLRHSTEVGWVDRGATELTGELTWASARVEGLDRDGSFGENWLLLDCRDGQVAVTDGTTATSWWATRRTAYPTAS